MNTRKKFISIILGFCLAFTLIGLPSNLFNLLSVKAVESSVDATFFSFTVNNIDDTFNLKGSDGKKTEIKFNDYCTANSFIQASVCLPNGNVAMPWTTYDANSTYKFQHAGLHMVQFRFFNNGFYTYSKEYFVEVQNDIDEFQIFGMVPSFAASGTAINIPQYSSFATIPGNNISVYSPAGNPVTISLNATGATFTNNSNELGKYFVEYSTQINVNGSVRNFYKYLAVEFVSEFVAPSSLNIVLGSGENDINYDTTNNYFYVFRDYNINNAFVKDENGNKIESSLLVAILDVDDNKYYSFNTKSFDNNTIEYINVNNASTFAVTSADMFTSATGNGHTYKFIYRATTCYATQITREITKTAKFNSDVISLVADSPVVNYIQIDKVDDAAVAEASPLLNYNVPSASIEVSSAYLKDKYNALVDNLKIEIVDSSNTYSSLDNYISGVGFDTNTNTYYERSKMTATKNVTLKYTLSYKNGNGLTGEISKNYTIQFVDSNKDSVAPFDISFDEYTSFIVLPASGGVDWTVPQVHFFDYDNEGNKTNGASVSISVSTNVKVNGNDTLVNTVEVGDVVTFEKLAGIPSTEYEFVYSITDANGNIASRSIRVVVRDQIGDSSPMLSLVSATQTAGDEDLRTVQLTFNTNQHADYVLIFEEGKIAFSPKQYFVNSILNKFEFTKEDGKNYSATLVKSNDFGCTYIGLKFGDSIESVKSYSFVNSNGNNVELNVNQIKNIEIGNTAKLKGFTTFQITPDENGGVFTIENANEIKFFSVGKFVIKNDEFESTANVIDDGDRELKTLFVNKNVAKRTNTIVLDCPYVENVFGYKQEIVVKNSLGNVVPLNDNGDLLVSATDFYTISYIITLPNGEKVSTSSILSAGNMKKPVIAIESPNSNVVYEGKEILYSIKSASAIDKNGSALTVSVTAYDPNGNQLTISADNQIKINGLGIYTIYYTAVDADGVSVTEKVSFVAEYNEKVEDDKISGWAIFGIVAGSIVGALLLTVLVWYFISQYKKKNKFISKRKTVKKKSAQISKNEKKTSYTIAQSKDEKYWLVKKNNKMIAKSKSKDEAIASAKADDKKGNASVRVYNKNGRLIDTF